MLENRQLAYFLAVAREGNVTAAADSLHMTQPALSRQMKGLERQLGCTLFERGRGVTLTDAGRLLQRRAGEMLDLMALTEGAFAAEGAEVAGEVSIGCGESLGVDLLACAMEQVRAEHPGVTFRIFSGNADAVLERMDKGLVDVGLLLGQGFDDRYEAHELPAVERFGVVVGAGADVADRDAETSVQGSIATAGQATREDLRRLDLIAPSQAAGTTDLSRTLGMPEQDLHIVARYNLISNALKLQRAGLGSVLGLESPTVPLLSEGMVFVPLVDVSPITNYVITKRDQPFSAATQALLTALRGVTGDGGVSREGDG